MNLAIIADEDFEGLFDNIFVENNYKIAQLNGESCAFLRTDDDFEKKSEVISKLGINKVLEITQNDISKDFEGFSGSVEYSGFSIKGNKKHVKTLVASVLGQSQEEKLSVLSEREKDVLRLLAKGMSNKDIAKTLFLSEKTVKNHLNNVFKKIDVTDRTNAALFALKNNLE